MGRLTRRNEEGQAYVLLYSDPDNATDVIAERARKEKEVIERLARYEDLEEEGALVNAPYMASCIDKVLTLLTCLSDREVKEACEARKNGDNRKVAQCDGAVEAYEAVKELIENELKGGWRK